MKRQEAKHAVLYPRPGGGLSFVDGRYHSIYGREAVRWEADGKEITLRVKIPANTTAEIRLDNGEEVSEADGLIFTEAGEYLTAQAGSGEYEIRYRMK